MANKFEVVLEQLFDYYGNFVQDPRLVKLIQEAGEKAGQTGLSLPGQCLSDDQLGNVAAAGDTDQASFFGNKANNDIYDKE
jgi:hypothetical protein